MDEYAEDITSFLVNVGNNDVITRDTFKRGTAGRLIVSSCSSPTAQISQFVDLLSNSLVKAIPSYFRDTADFLSNILFLEHIPQESLLLTLDVMALYTSVLVTKGSLPAETSYLAGMSSDLQQKTWCN